jgi:eukaryotic-like serine/threonine-protein kinase
VMEPPTSATRVAPPPPGEPPRGRRRWPIVAGILVLLAVVAAGLFVFLSGGEARAVTIPSVAGMPAADAERALRDAGLEVDVRVVPHDSVPEGQAIDTRPPAGEQVREGDTVVLRVSGGPGDVTVPDVVGQSEEAARAELSRAGFEVTVETAASDDVDQGLVIRQSPAGDSQAERGSTVTIVVSSGPEQVTVPDVRRREQSDAERLLRDRGLTVGDVSQRPSTDFAPGIVIAQDPGPTARVDRGSAVDITVAVAPANVAVPSVIGNTATDARTKLEGAGFVVTSDEAESSQPAGIVIDQSPPANTRVPPGRTVNITVSLGPPATTDDDDDGPEGAARPARGRGPDGSGPPGRGR